ncbi:MAG: Gfo/Idh/MocA family oxidoreductase [Dehalococcoidia bacterium]
MKEIYRVGVIGTGWAVVTPLPTFTSYRRTEVVAICSGRLERAQEAASRFGARLAMTDYHELVAHPEVDLVYICSPVHLHREMVLAAADAGKPILCEKPLSANAGDGETMLRAVESRSLPNIVAFTLRHYPWALEVKRLVESGYLGQIRQIGITHFRADPRSERSMDVARAGGGLPPANRTWLHDADLGGGMLGAMGSHYVDIVRHFFGDYADLAARTTTWRTQLAGATGEEEAATAEDSFAILATLRNGAMMTLQFSAVAPVAGDRRIEFVGSEGTIVIDGDFRMYTGRAGEPLTEQPIPAPDFSADVASSHTPRFGRMIEKLISWIETGAEASPNIRDAQACQRVLDAIKTASATQSVVNLA